MIVAILAIVLPATLWDGFFRKGWLAKRFGLTDLYQEPDSYEKTGRHSASMKLNNSVTNGEVKNRASVKSNRIVPPTDEMVANELSEPVGKT